MEPKKHRISTQTIVLITVVALFFDFCIAGVELLEFIPVIGNITVLIWSGLVSVFAWLTFYLWFKVHGVSFVGPKRILAFPIAFLAKLVPFVGIVPTWSAAVIFLFGTTRAEELLEKAGPLGTLASKVMAKGTQGTLSLARSQKSEVEKAS